MIFVVVVGLSTVLTWWATPRAFLLADRHVARRRVNPSTRALAPTLVQPSVDSAAESTRNTELVELSSLCDAVARALRSGRSAPDAMVEAIDRHVDGSETWVALRQHLIAGHPVADALHQACHAATAGSDERLCLELLLAAMVGPTPVAAGIEHGAAVLRDVASTRADLAVATSQARLSALILTGLPLVVLGGGIITNHGFRSSLTDASVLVPLVIGVVLNRLGWRWIMRLLDGVSRAAARFELADIVDRVCVSLMAGCSLAQACELLDGQPSPKGTSVCASISSRVREGLPLAECLEPLATTYSLQGRLFADVLVGAERDGLPVVATVARISQDVRIERRRRVDTAIRQIPVKLTIPLVICVLPGFLLTTLVPLVAASVGSLTVHLPAVLSPSGS